MTPAALRSEVGDAAAAELEKPPQLGDPTLQPFYNVAFNPVNTALFPEVSSAEQ